MAARPVVLDASAAAPWLIPDERTPVGTQLYLDVMASPGLFRAPALWLWETTNVLLVALRRGRIDGSGLQAGMQLLADCPLEFDPVPDAHRRSQTMRLSEAHGLSFYDASYLELALRLNSQFASSDRKLIDAAKSCGIPCLDL